MRASSLFRRLAAAWAGLAMAIAGPAFAQAAASDFHYDAGKYVQVVVKADTKDDVLNGGCPDKRAALFGGYSLRDLLDGKGDRSASVVIELGLPLTGFPTMKFDPVTLKIDTSFLSSKCEVGFHRIDYASPLMSMAAHSDVVTVKVESYRRRSLGGVFANSINDVLAAAQRFASIPGEAVTLVGGAATTLDSLGDIQAKTFDTRDIRISSERDGNGLETWTIRKFDDRMAGDIVITARLVVVDHLFDPTGSGQWTPSAILQRSWFVPNTAKPQTVESYLLTAAAGEYSTFNTATTASVALGACPALFSMIDRMGLTPRDNAILKWAVVRGHPNLLADADMDQMPCMASVWPLLPVTSAGGTVSLPDEFKQRVKAQTRPANYSEQSSLIEADNALALFFKQAAWVDREPLAERLFAAPMSYSDVGSVNLLRVASRQMQAPSDWLSQQWDTGRALARNIGCYSYRKAGNTDVPEGTAYALGNFITGPDGTEKEALLRIRFEQVDKAATDPVARISGVDIVLQPSAAEIAAIKLRHPQNCGGGWAAALLK